MPPSLSVSVGVPAATVTAPLKLSVSVTVFPAFKSPVEGDSTSEIGDGPGLGGSIARLGKVTNAPDKLAALPAPSFMVAPLGRLAWVIASAETVVSPDP